MDVKTGGEVVPWGHWARNGRPWAVEHLEKLPEGGGTEVSYLEVWYPALIGSIRNYSLMLICFRVCPVLWVTHTGGERYTSKLQA